MSLRVNKDNIFFILPESRYSVSDRIDKYMDEDFTFHISTKIIKESLGAKESFMFSRNGMHSGISAFKDSWGNYSVVFTYWFKDVDGNPKPKHVYKPLTDAEVDSFNEYTMICDHYINRQIDCYINGQLVGSIEYGKDEKLTYEYAFFGLDVEV